MKHIFLAAAVLSLAACAQANRDAAGNEGQASAAETQTAATTSSSMSDMKVPPAPPATATATAKKTVEEKKPMSYENKVAELHTTAGEIDIRFFPDVAPGHVKNFIDLAQKGFYDGTKFHRVIPGFMIQGGDPNSKTSDTSSWGTGGSGTYVKAEFNSVKHKRGIVSMARSSSPNSASSQFFIMVADYPSLDGQYSVFGEVTKGMDVADKIVGARTGQQDRPLEPTSIIKIVIRDANDSEKGATPK